MIWFRENIDKGLRARERVVGKVKRALCLAKERRTDVYRDFARVIVYVGMELVEEWDEMFKVMMFQREGNGNHRDIQATDEGGEEGGG